MTTRACLLITLLTLPVTSFAAAGPPTTLPTPHSPSEHVSAAWVDDAGSALVLVAGDGESRLIARDANGTQSRTPLPGFVANRLEVLVSPFDQTPGRLFLGGTTGDEYSYRLLSETGGAWKTVWDSREIPGAGSEDLLDVSHDGRFWALVRVLDEETVQVLLGELPQTVPAWSAEVRSRVLAGDEPSGPTVDFPSIAILGGDAEGLPDVALAWRGSVRVLGGREPGVKAVLDLPRTPGNLTYQSSNDVLWVGWGGGFSGYPLSSLEPSADTKPRLLEPDRHVTAEDVGFAPSQIYPLKGGGVAVTGGRADRGEIAIGGKEGQSFAKLSGVSGRYDGFEISSSGERVLALPRGPRSQEVVIHQPGGA